MAAPALAGALAADDGVPIAELAREVREVLDLEGIGEVEEARVDGLCGGERRRGEPGWPTTSIHARKGAKRKGAKRSLVKAPKRRARPGGWGVTELDQRVRLDSRVEPGETRAEHSAERV